MIKETSDFLIKETDKTIADLKNAKNQEESRLYANKLAYLKNKILFEIRLMDKEIEESR